MTANRQIRMALAVLGLATAALLPARPVRAVDYRIRTVNRSGQPQETLVIEFPGLTPLLSSDFNSTRFANQPKKMPRLPFSSNERFQFIDPRDDLGIPLLAVPTSDLFEVPSAAECLIGYTTEKHDVDPFYGWWATKTGVLTYEIPDAEFEFEQVGGGGSISYEIRLRNNSQEPLVILNGRVSMSMSNNRDRTDFLYPPLVNRGSAAPPKAATSSVARTGQTEAGWGDERIVATMSAEEILVPFVQPANGDQADGLRVISAGLPGGGGFQANANLQVIFRGTLFRASDTERKNPVSVMVRDQPHRNYQPFLSNPWVKTLEGATPVNPALQTVEVGLDAQDPDTLNDFANVPALELGRIELTTDADAPSGILWNPTGFITRIADIGNAHDSHGRDVRRLRVTAKLPRDLTKVVYYHFVFRATKNQSNAALRQREGRVVVTVEPQ